MQGLNAEMAGMNQGNMQGMNDQMNGGAMGGMNNGPMGGMNNQMNQPNMNGMQQGRNHNNDMNYGNNGGFPGNDNGYNDDFVDPDFLFDTIKDLGKKDITKLDYEGIIEELEMDDIEDYIEADDMGKAVGAVLKALDKNAKDCMGYEKKGKTVTYDIEVYDTMMVAVEALEKYFVDEDDYEELVEGLEDAEDYLKDMDNIEIEIVKDGKYISEITIDAGKDAQIKIELSDVNKVKEEIDEDIIDDMF
jgi:hypothetical protein